MTRMELQTKLRELITELDAHPADMRVLTRTRDYELRSMVAINNEVIRTLDSISRPGTIYEADDERDLDRDPDSILIYID